MNCIESLNSKCLSDKNRCCIDSGFLECSGHSCATMSDETVCSMRNMSLENHNEEKKISFRWSEIQNIGSMIKESPNLSFIQDVNGDTLLHATVSYNDLEFSLWLISVAPNSTYLDIQNDKSFTVLHKAVARRENIIARKLVLAGANPTLRTFSGNTALHIACLQGDFACAKALLEPSSCVEQSARYHQKTVIQASVIPQYLEIPNFQGKTCLHLAASNGYLDIVVLLVYSGANVNTGEGLGGKTAIHLAIQNNHHQVVRFLAKEQPACLDALTWSGCSVYQLALETDPQLAQELLELGANPELRSYSDYTYDESMSDSSSDG